MRALPKMATAGWIVCSRSVAVTNSAMISNIRHASRAELCERRMSWGSEGFGTLGENVGMGGDSESAVDKRREERSIIGSRASQRQKSAVRSCQTSDRKPPKGGSRNVLPEDHGRAPRLRAGRLHRHELFRQ